MKKTLISIALVISSITIFGQSKDVASFKAANLNWYNKDLKQNKIAGASVDIAYSSVLANLKPQKTVVVAVIDGGVDINHDDLKGKIWINADEIPNNNIDDDNNGYIDDINGWNYIGNRSGSNVDYENYEYTRLIKQDNNKYPKAKELYEKELSKRQTEKTNIQQLDDNLKVCKSIIHDNTGIDVKSKEDLAKVNSKLPNVNIAKKFLAKVYKLGFTDSDFEKMKEQNNEFLNYYLNKDFDARSIINDDPNNLEDRNYGNNDVKGPKSEHGTMVAGIIAATRDNNIGINGIASDVRIMVLRTTPNGDERDKDVALAIIYAADNGADIINMSFGKQFSPQKEFVDKAVKYAESKGVLMIHSAGNSGENIDVTESFPTDKYLDGGEATNWISVGASQMIINKEFAADFSNYGAKQVDIFAPGVDIISTDSCNMYNMHSGTSFSGPVVTGVAALVLSYFPKITPQQMVELLMKSSSKVTKPKSILEPSLTAEKRAKTSFSSLSKSGGIVNAYNALLLAQQKYGK
jgi:subtilisin family serine protease